MSAAGSGRIYLLAFDHRGSFQSKLLGIEGDPKPADVARIIEAKAIIFAGFRKALESGLAADGAGILVDEQFGADVARAARELGVVLAMPVERRAGRRSSTSSTASASAITSRSSSPPTRRCSSATTSRGTPS